MIFRHNKYSCYIGWLEGWFRIDYKIWFLRAPWHQPIFSERYGYYVWKKDLLFGWRLIYDEKDWK